MAHAGTTSTSTGQTGLWKALLAAVVIAAIFVGMVLAVPVITGRAASAPAVDNSYNLIEAQRGTFSLTGVAPDASSNAAEKARGGAFSGTTIDPSTYDRTPRGAHGQLP